MSILAPSAADVALAYHQRTKHHLHGYAAGPETIDWTSPPNPFREYTGAPRMALPLTGDALQVPFAQLYAPAGTVSPQPLSMDSLGALLELAFGLAAWKEYGPDRWAVRCNPSSGNLHPTEAYVITNHVPGMANGLYHYVSRDHELEQRSRFIQVATREARTHAWLGLSSIHWREAWKYGERAFRYCQLDVGHGLGAVRYAAAALGWQVKLLTQHNSHALAKLMGLDRVPDFGAAEREEPDLLLALIPCTDAAQETPLPTCAESARRLWQGHANVLDRHPMYRWPVIGEVASATEGEATADDSAAMAYPPLAHPSEVAAARIIKQRRSAQHFDGHHRMSAAGFFHLMDCLLPRRCTPWDLWDFTPRVHPVLFVHRVEDLEPGIYVLPRRPAAKAELQAAMSSDSAWSPVVNCPSHIPLHHLATADCTKLARTLHCHQAIAATGCFALGMLAEFDGLVREVPWRYRQLHWEAGLLGHVLYLEAETLGLRGTGIGCFFDDTFHQLLGLGDTRFQSLYHFTVGHALVDDRITTLPPYPARAAHNPEASP